jgi:hypothetical protein
MILTRIAKSAEIIFYGFLHGFRLPLLFNELGEIVGILLNGYPVFA